MSSPSTVTVEVCHGWAVTVDGEQVTGGTVVDVPADQAAGWVAKGWVALADPAPAKPKRSWRS
jgi:hypothetical protein